MAEIERRLRIFLDRVVDLRLAAHTGGVDEQILAEFVFKIAVDGVARRARNVGDDHALLAENAVEQARLADVRLADDGDLDDILVVFLAVRRRGKCSTHASSRSPVPWPWTAETSIGSPRPSE